MPTIFDRPLSRRATILILLGTLVALPVTAYTAITRRPRRFYASYDQVALDITENTLLDLFGREPDCICTLGENRILYYSRGAFLSDKRPPARQMAVEKITEIPWAYGCGQFLFDTKSKLSAYTINGEQAHISTREGDIKGSSFAQMEIETLMRLCLPASKKV